MLFFLSGSEFHIPFKCSHLLYKQICTFAKSILSDLKKSITFYFQSEIKFGNKERNRREKQKVQTPSSSKSPQSVSDLFIL